jgi:hypothetical protein
MLVELHCHSSHSDGLPTARQIIRKAERTVQAIAITDHNTFAGYKKARKIKSKIILIPGVEITCTLGSVKGHIIALGIEEFRRGEMHDVLDFIRQSGGVSIIAHPYRIFGRPFFDREAWKRADAIEVLNGSTLMSRNAKAFEQAQKMKKSMTSGSDAHWLGLVGSYACTVQGHDDESILKSIRKGKVILPEKSTSALGILARGVARKSRISLRALHKK